MAIRKRGVNDYKIEFTGKTLKDYMLEIKEYITKGDVTEVKFEDMEGEEI